MKVRFEISKFWANGFGLERKSVSPIGDINFKIHFFELFHDVGQGINSKYRKQVSTNELQFSFVKRMMLPKSFFKRCHSIGLDLKYICIITHTFPINYIVHRHYNKKSRIIQIFWWSFSILSPEPARWCHLVRMVGTSLNDSNQPLSNASLFFNIFIQRYPLLTWVTINGHVSCTVVLILNS